MNKANDVFKTIVPEEYSLSNVPVVTDVAVVVTVLSVLTVGVVNVVVLSVTQHTQA